MRKAKIMKYPTDAIHIYVGTGALLHDEVIQRTFSGESWRTGEGSYGGTSRKDAERGLKFESYSWPHILVSDICIFRIIS